MDFYIVVFFLMYEESVKVRTSIIPAVEKIITKEIPVLSATMKKFDA